MKTESAPSITELRDFTYDKKQNAKISHDNFYFFLLF